MYLVDTSGWIDFLRRTNTKAVRCLFRIIEDQIGFGITGVIYQEVLQGATSAAQFEQLRLYFSTQRFFYPKLQSNLMKQLLKFILLVVKKALLFAALWIA